MTVHDPAFYKRFAFQDLLLFTESAQGTLATLRVQGAVFPNAIILDIAGRKVEISLPGAEGLLFGDILFCTLTLEPLALTPLPWHQLFADPARDPALLSAMDANRQRLVKAIEKVRESATRIQAAKAAGTLTGALVAEGRALASEAEAILAGNKDLLPVQVRRISEDYSRPQYYDLGIKGATGAAEKVNSFVDNGSDKSLAKRSLISRIGAKETGRLTRLSGAINLVAPRADVAITLRNGQGNVVDVVVVPDDILEGTYGRDFVIGREISRWAQEHGEVI